MFCPDDVFELIKLCEPAQNEVLHRVVQNVCKKVAMLSSRSKDLHCQRITENVHYMIGTI